MDLNQAKAQLANARYELSSCMAPMRLIESKAQQSAVKIASVKGSGIAPTKIDSTIAQANALLRLVENANSTLFTLIQGINEAIGD